MEQFKGKAIASMVLGIVAVVFAWFGYFAIAGIAAGIIGSVLAIQVRKGCQEAGIKPDGMSMAGLVLSIIGLALAAILLIVTICTVCAVTSAYGSLAGLLS